MLRMLNLSNFKSFKETGDINITPITLLSGQNSSGKSSLLQSILAVKQTLESPYTDEPLILNGAYVSLGEYEDILNCYANKRKNISFAYTFDYENEKNFNQIQVNESNIIDYENLDEIKIKVDFARPTHSNEILNGSSPVLIQSQIHVKFEDEDVQILMKRSKKLVEEAKNTFNININSNFDDRQAGYKFKISKKTPISPQILFMNKFLPNRFFVAINKEVIEAQSNILNNILKVIKSAYKINESNIFEKRNNRFKVRELTRRVKKLFQENNVSKNDKVYNLLCKIFEKSTYKEDLTFLCEIVNLSVQDEITKVLEEGLVQIHNALTLKKTLVPQNIGAIDLLDNNDGETFDLNDLNSVILNSFNKIYYLGPLREEPKVFYRRLGASDPMYVGPKGENVAFVLKYYANREINAILPPSGDINWDIKKSKNSKCSLGYAVRQWLKYIGVADDVKVEEMGKLGLSIHANIHGDKDVDLVNVGVGVSQVLPLIVLGLASPEHSILLIEQPELHLHPFVQSRLGDFFICLSKLNKQVIAETHSEHLIHRMRYHVAKMNLDTKKDLAIYFSIRKNDSRESELIKIDVDDEGAIDDWPKGFFDETQKQLDEILLANFEKYGM